MNLKFLGFEFDENKTLAIYKIINKVNSDYVLGKITFNDHNDALILQVDTLETVDSFKSHFERYLIIIQQMEHDFTEEFNAL